MGFELDKKNKKLATIAKRVESNKTLQTYWVCSNINSIDRMGIHDHGKTHVYIVVNNALKMLNLLKDKKVYPSVVKDFALNKNIKKYKLDYNDAEVILFLAGCLHDVGISIHRHDHATNSMYIAMQMLDGILKGVYPEEEKAIVKSEILHSIMVHHAEKKPLTIEAGLLRIADALDMSEGRARIPFEGGTIDSHSISAMSIKDIKLTKSEEKPILISIIMSSPAGIFQIDNLLNSKIRGTGLEKYIRIEVLIDKDMDNHSVPEKIVFE
jgi:hypothetical protein